MNCGHKRRPKITVRGKKGEKTTSSVFHDDIITTTYIHRCYQTRTIFYEKKTKKNEAVRSKFFAHEMISASFALVCGGHRKCKGRLDGNKNVEIYVPYEIGTWMCGELKLYFYQSAGGLKEKKRKNADQTGISVFFFK